MNIKKIPLKGTLFARQDLPGDKSISHRALIFAALARSPSLIEGLNQGDDVFNTQHALACIGISWSLQNNILKCRGRPPVWQSPQTSINLGNSGTSARLLSGLMAALPLQVSLTGDSSLSRRPMARIITPLQ
ncbi:MAG TPA: 3-phosphoshikimate 1-carboxyvinyltransferase, partial [Candidatus Nitrosotenuis sp.]|nr:3-phosphoshikimate 1-carboxyvinyltransferase [Candidatus Nitrosotenuis sp.]